MLASSIATRIVGAVLSLAVLALGLSAFGVWTIERSQEQIKQLDGADARALYAERANHLVTATVMESRGVYMSLDTAPRPRNSSSRSWEIWSALKGVMQEWRAEIRPQDEKLFDNAAKSVEQFIAFRTELVRLAREDTLPAARRVRRQRRKSQRAHGIERRTSPTSRRPIASTCICYTRTSCTLLSSNAGR